MIFKFSMNSSYLILKLLILIVIKVCPSNSDGLYNTCNGLFSCGTISGLRFPFRRQQDPAHCGYPGFELNCDEQGLPTIDIMNITYRVLNIDPTSQILTLVRGDMINSICPKNLVNTSINHNLFDYTSSYMNISLLFECPILFNVLGIIGSISCANNLVSPVFLVPGIQGPGICETSVIIPFPVEFINSTGLDQVFQEGFDVRWKVESRPCTDCTQSGGQCIYNIVTRLTTCACPETALLTERCSTINKTDDVSLSPSSLPSISSGSMTFLSGS